MSENSVDPERIATVIESGETEAVNDLIDDLEDLDVDDQLATFEAAHETLLDCMDLEEGYSRQAVIRTVSALDPGTVRIAVETTRISSRRSQTTSGSPTQSSVPQPCSSLRSRTRTAAFAMRRSAASTACVPAAA